LPNNLAKKPGFLGSTGAAGAGVLAAGVSVAGVSFGLVSGVGVFAGSIFFLVLLI
jgi:hypothetical protein